MSHHVSRDELLDYQTYTEKRDQIRSSAMKTKDERRIHVGPHLTFLFENHETVLYQVQEMMRVEQIVREADIAHELKTYNELLGSAGELGCTLLIEIDDEDKRNVLLRRYLPLLDHVYFEDQDGSRAKAQFDDRQVGEDRLSSVQYLKFALGAGGPAAIGCDFEHYAHRATLTSTQQAALAKDLSAASAD